MFQQKWLKKQQLSDDIDDLFDLAVIIIYRQ